MQSGSKDPGAPGARPDRAPGGASQPTPFDEVRQLQDAELARQKALLDMLVDDARAGRVKDPEERNVKGRRDKKTPVTKVSRKGASEVSRSQTNRAEAEVSRASESKAADDASSSEAEQSATAKIDGAASALRGLKKTLTDAEEPEGEKIVRLHRLV